MTPVPTTTSVHSLRIAGTKVRVNHRRRYFDPVNRRWTLLTDFERSQSQLPAYVRMHEKGGVTEVEVTNQAGVSLIGVAECSKKEAYNRKRGVNIALGRILALSDKNNVPIWPV